jgi:hypothetical protein
LWAIRHADGSLASHSFTPPEPLAEVRRLYPDALLIEPEDDSGELVETDPEDIEPPRKAHVIELVTCSTCQHWRRDQVGDGSGLGSCEIEAPASKEL